MKRFVLFAVAALLWAADPPASLAPIKLTESEQLRIAKAQNALLQNRNNIAAAQDFLRNMEADQPKLQAALNEAILQIKAAHGCALCDIDNELNLVPRAKVPDEGKSSNK